MHSNKTCILLIFNLTSLIEKNNQLKPFLIQLRAAASTANLCKRYTAVNIQNMCCPKYGHALQYNEIIITINELLNFVNNCKICYIRYHSK